MNWTARFTNKQKTMKGFVQDNKRICISRLTHNKRICTTSITHKPWQRICTTRLTRITLTMVPFSIFLPHLRLQGQPQTRSPQHICITVDIKGGKRSLLERRLTNYEPSTFIIFPLTISTINVHIATVEIKGCKRSFLHLRLTSEHLAFIIYYHYFHN